MPIRPELLMRGLDGLPVPPQELVAKLKAFDPRIGLFYTKAAWAITEAWREDDPRRAWVQSGQMQEAMAFDICGHLPLTCSLDEALPYIERELRSYTPEQFTAIRRAVTNWNNPGGGHDQLMEDKVRAGMENSGQMPTVGAVAVAADLTSATSPTAAPHRRKKETEPKK